MHLEKKFFKKMFEEFKKMAVCYVCGDPLTPMNYNRNPGLLCNKCLHTFQTQVYQTYQPPIQQSFAQQNQNTQQATPLYVQQQQYINQFTQQAANVRAVGPQNIPPPLGNIDDKSKNKGKCQEKWDQEFRGTTVGL
uniref:Uncharacterized protein n=1 Tax=Meloidogyne enterolobii TaxID=390850 RepID=A0A6V7UM15_MELEN|nr:unnamed protein product [Meloidogyne enterolobii]